MTVNLSTSGGNTTVTFSYVATTAKMTNILAAAAHYLYNLNGNGGEFDSLTNAQKAAIIDAYVKQCIIDLAKSYSINYATETARSIALAAAETDLNL